MPPPVTCAALESPCDDWQVPSDQGWSTGLSPYAPIKPKSVSSNFSEFLVKGFASEILDGVMEPLREYLQKATTAALPRFARPEETA